MDDQVGLYGDVDQFVLLFCFVVIFLLPVEGVCVCIAVDQEVTWAVLGCWFAL